MKTTKMQQTMWANQVLVSDKRFAHSASPTLAGIGVCDHSTTVSNEPIGAAYLRERVGTFAPSVPAGVAVSASGRSPL